MKYYQKLINKKIDCREYFIVVYEELAYSEGKGKI